MPKISTRVTFDKKAAVQRIQAANQHALTVMGNQALKDVTKHVPKDQGALQNSGLTNTDKKAHDGEFVLRWEEPYGRYLWHGDVMYGNPTARTYGPQRISFTSALARSEWAKYASEVYGKDWKIVYQKAFQKGMKK